MNILICFIMCSGGSRIFERGVQVQADYGNSGGSRIFERGVQVQADYGNSTDCFITAGEYVYAEAVKLAPIRAKRGNFS